LKCFDGVDEVLKQALEEWLNVRKDRNGIDSRVVLHDMRNAPHQKRQRR